MEIYMIFNNFPQTVKILSVMEIPRKPGRGFTEGRDFHALSFRVKGDAVFITGGETITAKDESLALVPEKISYGIETAEELLYVVHFKTDSPIEINSIFTFTPQAPGFYENQFKKIYDLWKNKQTGYYFAATSCFYKILENIQKDLSLRDNQNNSDNMDKVMQYIHSNFTDSSLSVSALADMFGTSETYFRKTFKIIHKTTPLKYINNLRAEYAIELLESGYFLVSQVSERSGFSDAKYFARIIKNKTGLSPSELARN